MPRLVATWRAPWRCQALGRRVSLEQQRVHWVRRCRVRHRSPAAPSAMARPEPRVGAAQGAGNTYTGNPWDYAQNALLGGTIGGVLGAAGGAAFGRPVRRCRVPKSPTIAAEQAAERTAAYDTLAAHPARYDTSFICRIARMRSHGLRRSASITHRLIR